jgi:uncharacterized protein YegL
MSLSSPLGRGFAERIPLVLVLDTSDSMTRPAGAPRIRELSSALREWFTEAGADPALRERLEVAIVTFDSQVRVLRLTDAAEASASAFALVETVDPPELCASGLTLMLPAIETAVKLATERSRELSAQGTPSRRPLVWLVTDGAPCDERGTPLPEDEVAAAGRQLRDWVEATADSPGCLFYAVGVGGADLAKLRALAPESSMLLPDFPFRKVLRIASESASKQRPGSAGEEYARMRAIAERKRQLRDIEDEVE